MFRELNGEPVIRRTMHAADVTLDHQPGAQVQRTNLLPGVHHVPPYSEKGLGQHSAEYVDTVLEKEGDIGAVIAEPMRCTTVVSPPPEYWQRVRESCDRHGALLVFDEIPIALGRTGRMFCFEHYGVEPDIELHAG